MDHGKFEETLPKLSLLKISCYLAIPGKELADTSMVTDDGADDEPVPKNTGQDGN